MSYPRYRRLAVLLVIAWALPVASYLVHAAWLVPPVVLVVATALLRGGRGLLDRVVMAGALLFGALCVAGVLLSAWPWHLHPIAVGGAALTALAVFAHTTDRCLSLPRPTLADGLTIAAAGAVGLAVALPYLGADDETRLAMAINGEDGFRHLATMETIRLVGGYAFLHEDQAVAHMYSGDLNYPQGMHLLFGLLDGFVRSSATDLGSGLSGLHHYLAYTVLGFTALALAVIWAIQRLAEPMLSPGRRLVLVALAVTYLLSNAVFLNTIYQFAPQVAGLATVVVLIGVLARPPARSDQALWLVAALLVGIGFTYYLYLPPVGLAVLIWLYARRRIVARHRVALAAVIAGALVAALPTVLGVVLARQDTALLIEGSLQSIDGLLVVVGLAGAGLLRAWSTPRWRVLRWTVGASVLGLVVMVAFQRLSGGSGTSFYYANKMIDLVVLLLVLGAGSLLAFLPAPTVVAPSRDPRVVARWLAPAVAVAVALAGASGLVAGDSPYYANGSVVARGWAAGAWDFHHAEARVVLDALGRDAPAGTLVMVMDENPPDAYLTQLATSVLLRQYGPMSAGLHLGGLGDEAYVQAGYDRMVEALAPHPLLILVDTERTERDAQRLRDRHPDREITIAFQNR